MINGYVKVYIREEERRNFKKDIVIMNDENLNIQKEILLILKKKKLKLKSW